MIDKSQESDLLSDLGSRLKQIRLKKGLSQSQLALTCEMEKASLSKIESGKVNVSYITLYRLSKCLGVSMQDILKEQNL